MNKQRIEDVASAVVMIGDAVAYANRKFGEAMAAFAAATFREAITKIEEDEKLDPFAALLEAAREIDKQILTEELAEEPADLELPRKTPRPPKRLGPVNKANHTASRPPKRARSSCYRCRH